ncbi:MAG: AMP-binding protein [Actinomycetota bacterium]|nr:AMP-binding protein [Actinomycetota bacterium]MDK1016860.1 AMP-binding protein [Actinomycetota bacterium]MDK1026283.1 AMP-binding protein [Actinomycetota bacterium]MDK1038931.1 AMP-binding protein [Actinomycetota bacterium]MDK1097079.1 AMP-binding protein [Actinomycetota bacterium]
MPSRNMPTDPVWRPDELTLSHANLTAAMEERGIDSYSAFHRWSVDDPDGFWAMVIDGLRIVFDVEPSAIRGSEDVTSPDWLPDASFNIVRSCLDHDPDAVAIVAGTQSSIEKITVGELKGLVASFARGFADAGFKEGDAVAIVMPMTVEAVVAYLGVIVAGGVVVSIADSFAPREISTRFAITSPVAVVTQDRATRLGRVLPMYAKCVDADAPMCIVVDTGAGIGLREGDISWGEFVVPGAAFEPVSLSPSVHTNILFSSGTTADPKAIPWSQTTPLKAAMDGRFHQDIHAGDVVAWPTNLGWMMGPWLVYAALLNEASIALYDDAPTSPGFIAFVEEAGVTMLGVVPSIVAAWRAGGVLNEGDWSTVRVLSSTGEASNADDYTWLMRVAGNVPVIEICGGTELGGGYVTGTVLQPAVASRFTTPSLGLDLVLIDDGELADEGEAFLIPPSMGLSTELLNGDHQAVYYSDLPAWDGQLRRHGDQMARDEGGLYRALGRVDDTMNLGGIKVSSGDIEGAIGDLVGVSEVAAVAIPPADGGPERLVVFVVPVGAPDVAALRSEMQQRIRTRLNPLFKVHEVVLIDMLPRTASHKVMRRTLRAGYQR